MLKKKEDLDLTKIRGMLQLEGLRDLALAMIPRLPRLDKFEKAILYIETNHKLYSDLGASLFLQRKRSLKDLEQLISRVSVNPYQGYTYCALERIINTYRRDSKMAELIDPEFLQIKNLYDRRKNN